MFYGTFSIYPGQPKDIQTGIYRTGNAEVIKIAEFNLQMQQNSD